MTDDFAGDSEQETLPKYLRGWLGKLTARRWLRLFVFEFFVVLLGVLAAQGLQSWFADRSEVRVATAAKATLDRNLSSIARSAETRLRGAACYNYRLGKIIEGLKDGTPPEFSLRPPDEALVIDLGWTGSVPPLVTEHYDAETVEHYANAALWAESFHRQQAAEQISWQGLARLSPLLGKTTPTDQSIAKGSVTGALQNLRNTLNAANHLRRHAEELGLKPNFAELDQYRASKDPCSAAALGYSLDEHAAAADQGRLVTGEILK